MTETGVLPIHRERRKIVSYVILGVYIDGAMRKVSDVLDFILFCRILSLPVFARTSRHFPH